MTTIRIAGRNVENPAERLAAHLVNHGGTVSHYDPNAGTYNDVITPELIVSTRSPWMRSRISKVEGT